LRTFRINVPKPIEVHTTKTLGGGEVESGF